MILRLHAQMCQLPLIMIGRLPILKRYPALGNVSLLFQGFGFVLMRGGSSSFGWDCGLDSLFVRLSSLRIARSLILSRQNSRRRVSSWSFVLFHASADSSISRYLRF